MVPIPSECRESKVRYPAPWGGKGGKASWVQGLPCYDVINILLDEVTNRLDLVFLFLLGIIDMCHFLVAIFVEIP